MNHYVQVFFEAIWSASIVPFASEATFMAMKLFGGFNMPLAVVLAVTGAMLGQTFNWFAGKLLLKLHVKKALHVSDYWYNKIAYLFGKYGIFLLLFSWAPMFKVFVVAAGFLNIKPRFVLPLVFAGQLFNYGQHLL